MHQVIGAHLRRLARVGVGGQGEAAAAQDFQAEVAAAFGPFVGLLGQDGADEANDGVPVGEDPDDVGAAADLSVELTSAGMRPRLETSWPFSRAHSRIALVSAGEVFPVVLRAALVLAPVTR